MLDYSPDWFTLYPSLISWRVVSRSFVYGAFAAFVTAILTIIDKEVVSFETSLYNDLLSTFSYFFFIGLGFRFNFAMGSWNGGVSNICKLINNAKSLFKSFNVIMSISDKEGEAENVNKIKKLILNYISYTFYICTDDSKFTSDLSNIVIEHTVNNAYQNMQLKKNTCILEEIMPSTQGGSIIEQSIKEVIIKSCKDGFYDSKTCGYLLGLTDRIVNVSNELYGIKNVPPPCIVVQMYDFYMYCYLILYAMTVVPFYGYYACILNGIWIFVIGLMINVACEIDSPFGTDKNDIKLDIIMNGVTVDFENIDVVM